MTDSRSQNEAHFRRHWWGYGVGLVALFALAGPTLNFVAAGQQFLFGSLFAATLSFYYMGSVYEGDSDSKILHGIAAVFGALMLCVGIPALLHASAAAAANDKRCIAIQRDMLSSMPLRSDDPDLFQALGCRPQGQGSVYAERDTKTDRSAMREQDARRSKLPYRSPYLGDGSGAVLK